MSWICSHQEMLLFFTVAVSLVLFNARGRFVLHLLKHCRLQGRGRRSYVGYILHVLQGKAM